MHASLPAALLCMGLCACQPPPSASAPAASSVTAPGDASDPTHVPRAAPAPAVPDAPAAGPAIPPAFVGRYAASAAACAEAIDDSRLEVAADTLRFHESSGEVAAVDATGDELRVSLRMRGEGEAWTRDYRFRREADGALLDTDGGLRRVRCAGG